MGAFPIDSSIDTWNTVSYEPEHLIDIAFPDVTIDTNNNVIQSDAPAEPTFLVVPNVFDDNFDIDNIDDVDLPFNVQETDYDAPPVKKDKKKKKKKKLVEYDFLPDDAYDIENVGDDGVLQASGSGSSYGQLTFGVDSGVRQLLYTTIDNPYGSHQDFTRFMESFERRDETETQTHMWMPPRKVGGKFNFLLHVTEERREEFQRGVYHYITTFPREILNNRFKGDNCITEKVNPNKFKFYIDLDFKIQHIASGIFSKDKAQLQEQVTHLVNLIDNVVSEVYSDEIAADLVLTMRVPYKLHLHYTSIVTNAEFAKAITARIVDSLKSDELAGRLLTEDPKVIDSSVYTTGLRMIHMHKGRMIRDKVKDDMQVKLHWETLPLVKYNDIYSVVDTDTWSELDMPFELFKRLSIQCHPDTPMTVPTISLAILKSSIRGRGFSGVAGGATGVGSSLVKGGTQLDDTDFVEFMESSEGIIGHAAAEQLPKTRDWLQTKFNRIIPPDKIKIKSNSVVVPLNTRECQLIGREHASNHQYIKIDMGGARQVCHDCHKAHHTTSAKLFPAAVKEELVKAGVLHQVDLTKRPTKRTAKDDEDGILAFKAIVDSFKSLFPRYDFSGLNVKDVVIKPTGYFYSIPFQWCEVCKVEHDSPCGFLHVADSGKFAMRCTESDRKMDFGCHPNPPMNLDQNTKFKLFVNIINNNSFTQNLINIHNYTDASGDVDIVFEKLDIFDDDPVMNHLVFEALTGTTYNIVKVFHHIAKNQFNCTNEGIWYRFFRHRWVPNEAQAVINFISTDLADVFRQTRDFYRDNITDPDLAKKCFKSINDIVTTLKNIRNKQSLVQEAQAYFYHNDVCYDEDHDLHFEDKLDTAKQLLGFTNGVYDLDEMTFRDGRAEDCVTMSVKFPYVAESDPIMREKVMRFICDVLPNRKIREYCLQHLASSLHGENNQEHFHIYTGKGRNGKSKLQDLINYTFGDYFSAVPVQLLTRPQGDSEKPNVLLVSLKPKRMIIASEPQKDEQINVAFLKQISGNDFISCRANSSNKQIVYKPQFQLIMLCNEIPKSSSSCTAFYARSRIVDFPSCFVRNPNPELKHEKLVDENLVNEIHNWKSEFMLVLLEYYQMYKDVGKKLFPPERVKILVEKHKLMSDPVSQYYKVGTKEAPTHYSFQGMWNHYQQWFSRNFSRKDMAQLNIADFKSAIKRLTKLERVQCKDTGNKQTAVPNRDLVLEEEQNDSCSDSDSDSDDDSDDDE